MRVDEIEAAASAPRRNDRTYVTSLARRAVERSSNPRRPKENASRAKNVEFSPRHPLRIHCALCALGVFLYPRSAAEGPSPGSGRTKPVTIHTTISNTPYKHLYYTHSVLVVSRLLVYGTETTTAIGQPDMPNVHGDSAAVYSFSAMWLVSCRRGDAQHCPKKEFP
jgi:hypothetical protein